MTAVFSKAFRDSRKTMIWLAIGLGLYSLFIMAFYPTIVDQSAEFDKLLKSYPKGMMSLFYSGNLDNFSLSDPGIFVQTYVGSWSLLILGAMVVVQGFNAFTNAERDGSMDMLLSLPIARRSLLVGRVLNTAALVLVTLTVIFLVFAISTVIWPVFDVNVDRLALGIYGAFFPLMVVTTFTFMLATLIPSSRRFAGPLAHLFLFGSYLIYGFSGSVDQLSKVKPLLLFDYYNASTIIHDGLDLGNWLILSAVALVYFAVAWWAVERKDLGV